MKKYPPGIKHNGEDGPFVTLRGVDERATADEPRADDGTHTYALTHTQTQAKQHVYVDF